MYVQTANGFVNYVVCVAITGTAGTTWHVEWATGDYIQIKQYQVLCSDTSPNQPLTRDCTIITNGNNYLKVYLDNNLVYTSTQLNLQMPLPFNLFLEPQTSYAGQMLYGIYRDFYIALDENIKVVNAPLTAARVDVVDPSGNVLTSAPVHGGTAIINIGRYHFPISANIKVYDVLNLEVASTSSPISIVGGDIYSVNSSNALAPLTINSSALAGVPITGL